MQIVKMFLAERITMDPHLGKFLICVQKKKQQHLLTRNDRSQPNKSQGVPMFKHDVTADFSGVAIISGIDVGASSCRTQAISE